MLSGDGNENKKRKTIGLISKKLHCKCSTFFSVHFFAVVLHDYNVNLPENS